jgi:arginyl-tRNA synthetase
MRNKIRTAITECLKTQAGLRDDQIPAFTVEVPNQESHGDFATNVAMMLARTLKKSPKQIAADLVESLNDLDVVERTEVAGPGFINFFIQPDAWHSMLREILRQGAGFGRGQRESREKVMVEFVSANPTGPLHFGHGRGAVIGDVLANLLEFSGHDVFREFYVNDAGRQVHNLALSIVYWLNKGAGQDSPFPEDGYRGDYVQDLAHELPAELQAFAPGEPDETTLQDIEKFAVQAMLKRIQIDLEAFGVRMDKYASEKNLLASGGLQEAFTELERLEVVEDRDGARWFASDRFGDEKPRVLIKSDGSNTYFATDVAYHLDKLRRGYERLINVWGADHHGYVPRMKAVLKALGRPPEALDILLVQMVSLVRDGQPVVLSKRAGEITTLRQVFEEVGQDAARFFFLMRGADSQMEFDLNLAKKQSLDNPVFYVQYGHARLSSILVKAQERGITVPAPEQAADIDLSPLNLPEELRLIRRMADFPEAVRRAADAHAPHQLVFYLQELVGGFHSYYTFYGRTSPILGGDEKRIAARLIMVQSLRQVLRNAMALLGVTAPDRMAAVVQDTDEAGQGQEGNGE